MVGEDIIVKFGADLTALKAGFTEAKTEGDSLGSKLGGVGTAAAAGLGVAAVAIGAFAIQSASTVNGAFSTMAKATGLQGTQLAGLETSWKSVYASVPVDATTLTGVVDKLNNSLHLQCRQRGRDLCRPRDRSDDLGARLRRSARRGHGASSRSLCCVA